MKCERVRELLPEYSASGLSRRLRRQVERHLAACEACRGELAAFGELDAMLFQATPDEPPAGLWNRIEARLTGQVPSRRTVWRWAWAPATALVAAAGIYLLVVGPFAGAEVAQEEGPLITYEQRHAMLGWNDPLADRVGLGAVGWEEANGTP
jgi:anti-sigma factor RsiW